MPLLWSAEVLVILDDNWIVYAVKFNFKLVLFFLTIFHMLAYDLL